MHFLLRAATLCSAMLGGLVVCKPAYAEGYVESGILYHGLSSGYQDWEGLYLKGASRLDEKNVLTGELLQLNEYGESGTYVSLSGTHEFNADWYVSLAAGTSRGGFFLPHYRVDGLISRKWMSRKNLVTSFGAGYYKAKDPHRDLNLFAGAAYYFAQPWIIEGGYRYNLSQPGKVGASSQFLAVTQGQDKKHFLTLRYELAREAYQILDPERTLSNFHSRTASLVWRQWLSGRWGVSLRGEDYHNPYYDRQGIEVGVFMELQ